MPELCVPLDDGSAAEGGVDVVRGRHWVPSLGLPCLVLTLSALAVTPGLGPTGWFVGLGCGAVLLVTVAVAAARSAHVPGPADLVTLTRATLCCGVAALVADFLDEPRSPAPLVALAVTVLVLDLVDGRVARRTGTISTFGARFDGEADAFLMLVLSVYVAASFGPWVLAIGAVRYLFGAAGLALPWMRGSRLPSRYWRKVVTATSGIVLTVAAAHLLPDPAVRALLLLVLLLLAESFGRDVWWLAGHRPSGRTAPVGLRGPGVAKVDA